jgi:hypothetical protein
VKLKEGVNLQGVVWEMFWAAVVAEKVYKRYGQECVITSANDGKHGNKTLHHQGKALDLRTWTVSGREHALAAELRNELGPDYDVVVESDHIHVEHDPE